MGKSLTPYIFWALFNNQFCNGTLRGIKYYSKHKTRIRLTAANIIDELKSLITEEVKESIRPLTFRASFEPVIESLKVSYKKNELNETVESINDFSYNEIACSYNKLIQQPFFWKAIFSVMYEVVYGASVILEKDKYIVTCISEDPNTLDENPFGHLYKNLVLLREEVSSFYINNSTTLPNGKKVLPKDIAQRIPRSL